jgi:hypothetical protein
MSPNDVPMSPSDDVPEARSRYRPDADSHRSTRRGFTTSRAGQAAFSDLDDFSGLDHSPETTASLDVFELCEAAGLYESEDLVRALLDRVPEFAPHMVALVKEYDDDPGEPMVLIELADFIAPRLDAMASERLVVEAAMAFVETLLESRANDEVSGELFGAAFFDSFTPEDQQRLAPWLGPRARSLVDALDMPPSQQI